ncbi:MAG TPA: hypothetical protein DHU96_09295 [Actinobacteria bacterium]|nr:hypothetical protein [Actinomycetota bacterium]
MARSDAVRGRRQGSPPTAGPAAAAELAWFAGGRQGLLRDARAVLRAELERHPEDEEAHAAARLVVTALSRDTRALRSTPAAQGEPEGFVL